MSSGYNPRRSRKLRKDKRTDLRPSWSWLAIPLLVVGVVVGLWWGLYSPSESSEQTVPTLTPTAIQRPRPSATATMVVVIHTPTPAPTPTATVVAGIGTGRTVKVTASDGLNLRAGPGANKDLIRTMPVGTVLTVEGGPAQADGHTWWQVKDDQGNVGWCVEEWLEMSLP